MCTQYDERAIRIEFVGVSQRFIYVDSKKPKVKVDHFSDPGPERSPVGPEPPGRHGSQA